ncbi:MAG: co-chaperone YbbN [Planctomycetota bacterium]|nr:MAG: co-chaperone YbbN [Planctomycetota bacterium]REJ89382.1 MAG: co-chaperone YbbN [Planctomycetota bacterium]REK30024.1 MAG: co-chaperone YbbN [Planctomycetota bacterium]REK37733.1 MAG: co-chaperone YbbN [Planctomycetota bacterium]
MASLSEWVIDTGDDAFERDVMQRSESVPVVVDFWSPGCQPCLILAPILERLVAESEGAVVLAKVNIDENQRLAYEFGVQSIPFVVAVRNREMIDAFRGALPEPQLRDWLSRIVPSPADQLVSDALAAETEDREAAEAKLREALTLQQDHAAAKTALARILLHSGRADEARELIAELEQRGFLEPEAERVKSELEIATAAADAGGIEAAREAIARNPDDLSARVDLAEALAADRQYREALDLCLEVISQDKSGVGVAAKDAMLKILNLAAGDGELVSEYRRKLSSALY